MGLIGWTLYAPGDGWVEDLVSGPWELEALTEPAGGWHGGFFVHSQEQPWEVERRLRTVSGRAVIPKLACYVETSDFGYALALRRGELVARYVVNAPSAEIFVEGVWALEQCVALHGRDWQQTAVEALARWSSVAPRPLTAGQLEAILAGRHLFPEHPLFNELGLALGIEAADPHRLEANVSVLIKGEIPPEHHRVVAAAFESLGVAAQVWVGPTPPGLSDVQCLVLARVWLQPFLDSLGSEVAGGAHGGLERLVDRLFAHGPKTARPRQVLVLEDMVTSVQVVVTADLPAVAYQRLVAVDRSSIQHGWLHYDRLQGQWRAESGPWQQRWLPPADQAP
jgi:hypothetical protein